MEGIHILPGLHAPEALAPRPVAGPVLRNRESDAEYFHRRAAEERAFAARSSNHQTRSLHLEIADHYGQLSAAIQEADDRLG